MRRKLAQKTIVILFWTGVWAAAAKAVGQTLLLPSPGSTLSALVSLSARGDFWLSAGASVLRIAAGFAAGFLLGAALAALAARVRWTGGFFAPILSIVKATPVVSFIMLALVWFRSGAVPVFATSLIVLPVAFSNLSASLTALDRDLIELGRAFRLRPRTMFSEILWPQIRPSLLAAVMSGMGMAWKAGVAAEVICTPRNALGSWLYGAKIYLNTPELFAATVVVIALSMLLEGLVVRLSGGRKMVRQNA